MTYQEFPQKFVWKPKQGWKVRQRGFAIGQMYFIAFNAGEQYFLWLLLTVVKGSTSFVNLQTVNGVEHETFQGACLAMGLLEDDGEYIQCLQEASEIKSGAQLCALFVIMLQHGTIAQPDVVWAQFREKMCDDLHYRIAQRYLIINPTDDQVYDFGLYLLNKDLIHVGLSLIHFPSMPTSQDPLWEDVQVN